MLSKFKRLILFILILGTFFLVAQQSLAATVDVGTGAVDSAIALNNTSPFTVVTNIINFSLGLLSLLALCLILWGGFIWMTSGGSEEKIETAKKILRNGVIGLIIILSAWGIAFFILSKLVGVTGGTDNGLGSCTSGSVTSCGCGGAQTCNGDTWGPCLNSSCLIDNKTSCDGNLSLSGCQADDSLCGTDYLCGPDCLCTPKAGLGDSCNTDASGSTCKADDNLCGPYLKCDPNSCVCTGPPVITGISPAGGFCNNDQNRGCNLDTDCLGGAKCDVSTPNGTTNNFITIYGYNFGTTSQSAANVLASSDFDESALGSVPTDWTAVAQKHSSVGIVSTEFKSGKQSVDLHQDANLTYPGTCSKATCQDLSSCTWNATDSTCHFTDSDAAHLSGPAVYHEGENLVGINSYNVMLAELSYNFAPLNLVVGSTYSVQFYYKGHSANDISVSAGPLTMASIPGGVTSDWTLYSYSFQYTPEMDNWLDGAGNKTKEINLSAGYNSTGSGTDLYVDDFTITNLTNNGQVTFLGTSGNQAQLASNPSSLNPSCINSWTDRQIIVAVPSGSVTGPLEVKREGDSANSTDKTNDAVGPQIPDFVKNSISRPGLCLIDPVQGLLGSKVVYQGINLKNSAAYFGAYSNAFAGINSNFLSDNLSGQTLAPSITAGLTTTFVEQNLLGINQQSNALDFTKQQDPAAGPYISSFSPVTGQAGQYVTISGSGFGNMRGSRQVFFGDTEASYDFPDVCANSVWNNNQIIVKVPDGLSLGSYGIKINLGDNLIINTDLLSPNNTFKFNPAESLKTSLCKIDPIRGQIGDKVSLWGEYFGNSGTDALAVFSRGVSTSSTIIKDGLADRIDIVVPIDNSKTPAVPAITGPVHVMKNGVWGNELNFVVGKCASNSECGASSPICCADNTYKAGSCAATLLSCYFDVPNSVYETKFNTSLTSTTTSQFDSCIGMAAFYGTCQTGQFCPNSPGKCSPFNPSKPEVTSDCGSATSECGALDYCNNNIGVCVYNKTDDVCQTKACQLEDDLSYSLSGSDTKYTGSLSCRAYNDKTSGKTTFVKELKVNTSCPSGWVAADSGYCINTSPVACEPCPTNFKCVDNGSGNNVGICESSKICELGASCGVNPDVPSKFSCLKAEQKTCDCCCEIGQDARDCCAPLKCSGTCGSDTTDDGVGFGRCSGCAGVGTTTAEHDAACNCSMASGKYCQIDSKTPTGACVDCAALDEAGCSLHSQQCCFDATKKTCQGGDGTLLPGGKCAYYDCDASDKTKCNATATTTGQFLATSTCATTCASNPQSICDLTGSDAVKCSTYGSCCFDFKNDKCVDGLDKINSSGINYCAYYNCDTAKKICDVGSASTTGAYLGVPTCQTNCSSVITSPGSTCASANINACDTSFCGNPYSCRTAAGAPPTVGDCGICCCDPQDANACSDTDGLKCLPNKSPCGGDKRGLCCGCKSDSQCGNSASEGCGGDTCCHGRPNVISTSPVNGKDKVCRNSQIVINFDTVMDIPTLTTNILLVEEKEYGKDTCQDGAVLSFNNFKPKSVNIFVRLYQDIASNFRHILGLTDYRAIAAGPSPDKLYCVTPAAIDVQPSFTPTGASSTVVYIQPLKVLNALTNYFVVVKGDENLDSNSGVMSADKIGLNGSGSSPIANASFNQVVFKNSYTFGFTTMDNNSGKNGLCTIADVEVNPNSFLINSADNDPSDDTPGTPTFDTVNDNDRALSALAYSVDNQLLQPVTGYYWNWNWKIADATVAKNLNTVGLEANQIVVAAMPGVTDKSTQISATADMTNFSNAGGCVAGGCLCSGLNCSNKCCNATLDGDGLTGDSTLYVFLCANPWPMEKNGIWSPWSDKCTDASGNPISQCVNYNYKFYYCRDAGEPGTADDLPAVMDPALILGSSDLVCSTDGTSCTASGSACGTGGTCIWNVLKESYFFREAIPQAGEITQITSTGAGGQVVVSWYSPISTSTTVASFKIYYGLASGSASSYVTSLTLQEASCNASQGKNYCSYIVSNLIDGQNYYFKVSSVSDKKAESPLSGSENAIPTDTTPPATPTGLKAEISNGQIIISWTANTDDTLFYRLFHGLFSGKISDSVDSPNGATSLQFDENNYRAGDHFFSLSAVDKSGNVSPVSGEVKLTIPAAVTQ